MKSKERTCKLAIYVEPPKGGFGDVAPNLLMAKHLRDFGARFDVSLVLHRRSLPQFQKLVPNFNPDRPVQKIDHITIYCEHKGALPKFDVLLSFSSRARGPLVTHDAYLKELAPIRIGFFEPDGSTETCTLATLEGYRGPSEFRPALNLHLHTGVSTAGLYLSEKLKFKFSDRKTLTSEIIKTMDEESSLRFRQQVGEILNSDEILFLYSKQAPVTELYLGAISEFHKYKPKPASRRLVFYRAHESLPKLDDEEEVCWIPYQSLGFDVSATLIANANYPVLVTGDTSLALALSFGKPFLYETNSWKGDVARDLADLLLQASPTGSLSNRTAAALARMTMLDPLYPEISREEAVDFLVSRTIYHEIERQIRAVRPTLNLAEKISNLLEGIQEVDLEFLMTRPDGPTLIREFVHYSICETGPKTLSQRLTRQVLNEKLNFRARARAFLLALHLKDWKSQSIIESLGRAVMEVNPIAGSAFQYLLLSNLKNNTRVYELLRLFLESSDTELRKRVLRMLYSAHSVSLSEDPMSLSSNIATQLFNEVMERKAQHRANRPGIQL